MRKTLLTTAFAAVFAFGLAAPAAAEPVCGDKVRGTITCTETESPGKNRGDVGSETTNEFKGNTKNQNPPMLKKNECEQNPEKAQGSFSCP
jgi:hypothetical protein